VYCPQCATQNSGEARFCRACRAPIGLVSRVLRGEAVTPEDPELDVYLDRGFRRLSYHRPPNLMAGAAYLLVGLGALLSSAAAILAPILGSAPPVLMWIWPLVLGLFLFAEARSEFGRHRAAKEMRRLAGENPVEEPVLGAKSIGGELSAPRAFDIPPPSVVEDTTRRLEDDPTAILPPRKAPQTRRADRDADS
jgi:hypothetical protein